MAAKKAKLREQFEEEQQEGAKTARKGIFSGVAVFVNGHTEDFSGDEIKRVMMTHGGVFHHYFDSAKTTHVIASNLADTKVSGWRSIPLYSVQYSFLICTCIYLP